MTTESKTIPAAQPTADTKRRLLGGTMLDHLGHAAVTAAGLLYAVPAHAGGSSMPSFFLAFCSFGGGALSA